MSIEKVKTYAYFFMISTTSSQVRAAEKVHKTNVITKDIRCQHLSYLLSTPYIKGTEIKNLVSLTIRYPIRWLKILPA